MKYSELKEEFVTDEEFLADEVFVVSNKLRLTFNTAAKSVQLYWGDDLKGSKKYWSCVILDFPPVIENDGEIVEVNVHPDEDLMILKLSSNKEVQIYCNFIDNKKNQPTNLLWSSYPLSKDDVKWLKQHHKADKFFINFEGDGERLQLMAFYKESGLQALRFLQAQAANYPENRSKERVSFISEGIPLKNLQEEGDVTISRYKTIIEISHYKQGGKCSYRTPVVEENPGVELPWQFRSDGYDISCNPNTGKLLKDLIDASNKSNKKRISIKMEAGVLEIGNSINKICMEVETKIPSASVSVSIETFKKWVDFMPSKFPEKGLGIIFPDQLNGLDEKGKKIPEYLMIVCDTEYVDEDQFKHKPNRFLLKCQVNKLFIVNTFVKKVAEVVEKTAETAVEVLDAISSKLASDPSPLGDITPEFIQEKKKEIEAIAKKVVTPLRRDNLPNYRRERLVLQAHDGLGRIFEIIYEIETSALSQGILLDIFDEPVSLTKTKIEAEVKEDINKLGQFLADIVKKIQDPATEYIQWTLEQIQKTLEALEAGLKVSSKAVEDTTQEITNILNGITKTSEQFVKQLLQQIINYWNEYWKERILECILSVRLAEEALTIVSKTKKNNPNFSSSQIAQNLINEKVFYSFFITGITGIASAVPGATLVVDLGGTTPLLIQMVYEIACAYEQDIKSPESRQEILAILSLTFTTDNLPKMGLGFLIKHTPIPSFLITGFINATLFLAVGYAACQYYEVKVSGKDPLSAETYEELLAEVNSYVEQLITEGKKIQEIVNKAISLKDKLPAAT